MHTTTQERIIRPARNIMGSLRLPGDKSISHRYGMLGAFAEGTSRFRNFSTGADCASTLACMEELGATVRKLDDGVVEVDGVGGRVTPTCEPLDCGNSGSTMRMISGLLAPQKGRFTLVGDASLSRRPMERVRKPLAEMGARLTLTEGHAPVVIEGTSLSAIDYTTPVPSAQVKTCVLLAGLQTAGTTTVREAVRTRDHSELALRAFGAKITRALDSVSVTGPQTLNAIDAVVPGDISSAAFFMCAAALFPGSGLLLDALGLNPTRAALLDVLTALGARIAVLNLEELHSELVGTVQISADEGGLNRLKSAARWQRSSLMSCRFSRRLLPTRAAAFAFATPKSCASRNPTASRWLRRICEPWARRLRNLKTDSTCPADKSCMVQRLIPAAIIALRWLSAVAALRAEGETLIQGAESASISFPEFFELLDLVAER